tara:strand:+ start:40 stop:1536 length:1497 start_codon:yes stop_codon:yes gene_type:complete
MKHISEIIDEILIEWGYRVHNGMPDVDNPIHLTELKDVMKERKFSYNVINQLISNLNNRNRMIISEADTSRTESTHEIYFAIAMAALLDGTKSMYNNLTKKFKTFEENSDLGYEAVKKMIRANSSMKNPGKHWKVLMKFHKKAPLFTSKKERAGDLDKWKDGMVLAEKTLKYIKTYTDHKPKSSTRVFDTSEAMSQSGVGKAIADAVVYTDKGQISISLKYGKAQFNSLSVKKLFNMLFGVELNKGILRDMYAKGGMYKSQIDETFDYYVPQLIGALKQEPLSYTKKYTEEHYNEIMNSGMTEKSTWGDYQKTSAKQKKAFSKAYGHPDLTGLRKAHQGAKSTHLNNAVQHYIESHTKGYKKNLEETLIYLMRAEPKTTYLYAADGGKKFALFPSQKDIKGKKIELKDNFSLKGGETGDPFDIEGTFKSSDYTYDVDVIVDGIKAFTFDIKWRFAGKGGQWDTDLMHKGAKIIFHKGFAKAFGLPSVPKSQSFSGPAN